MFTDIESIEFTAWALVNKALRLKTWMGAPFPSNLLSHKDTVPSMPALARSVSVNFKLIVLSFLTVEKRI